MAAWALPVAEFRKESWEPALARYKSTLGCVHTRPYTAHHASSYAARPLTWKGLEGKHVVKGLGKRGHLWGERWAFLLRENCFIYVSQAKCFSCRFRKRAEKTREERGQELFTVVKFIYKEEF